MKETIQISQSLRREALENRDVMVCIRCITYNHEPYIRDTLEGFVMQQTNFPFVAIVHDDASTDGTADIIREYTTKYPDIIKPIYETENQYSKRDGTLGRIMDKACLDSNAKYIAICEGDDYWTDPLKLQKQVDFLESHPDYSLVFANARLHYDSGLSNETFPIETKQYTPLELYKRYYVPTPTIIYRATILNSDCFKTFDKIKNPVFGDLTICMAATTSGKVFGMNDIVCGYRRLSTGATNYLFKHPRKHFLNRIALSNYLGKQFKEVDRDKFVPLFIPSLSLFHENPGENIRFLLRLFWFAPWRCTKELIRIPKSGLRRLKNSFKSMATI